MFLLIKEAYEYMTPAELNKMRPDERVFLQFCDPVFRLVPAMAIVCPCPAFAASDKNTQMQQSTLSAGSCPALRSFSLSAASARQINLDKVLRSTVS